MFNKYSSVSAISFRTLVPSDLIEAIQSHYGKNILHLFCSFGIESLYVSQITDAHVTGVDYSSEAIRVAKLITEKLGLECEFIENECGRYLTDDETEFDAILTTLGSLWWVKDLREYFQKCFQKLSPDGHILIWDFHPIVHCFNDLQEVFRSYPIGTEETFHDCGISKYQFTKYDLPSVNVEYKNEHLVTDYRHSLGAIIEAAISSGFRVDKYKEYFDTGVEKYFDWQEKNENGVWVEGVAHKRLPLTYFLELGRNNSEYVYANR